MKAAVFARMFEEECSYYDQDKREISTILKVLHFRKNDRLVDIGAGTGRLAVPLSRYVNVTAVDSNKATLQRIPEKSIHCIHKKIEKYYPRNRFDYALIAWPQFSNYEEISDHIRRHILKKRAALIVVKAIARDLNIIRQRLFPDYTDSRKPFLGVLRHYFVVKKSCTTTTGHKYPDIDTAVRITNFELTAFHYQTLGLKKQRTLAKLLLERKCQGNIYLRTKLKVLVCTPIL